MAEAVMLTEVREQPSAVARTVEALKGPAAEVAAAFPQRPPLVLVAARGTSHNASHYAKYLFEVLWRVPVSLSAPSVLTLYRARLPLEGALAVGISQSGAAADVGEVLTAAKEGGAVTVAVTNEPESPLAGVADHVLLTQAGKERAIPATKTYTSQLAALALLVATLARQETVLDGLREVPRVLGRTLEDEQEYAGLAPILDHDGLSVLGRGYNYATALEAALKLKETALLPGEAWSGAEYLHGPVAVAGKAPALIFAPEDATAPSMGPIIERLSAAGSAVVVGSKGSPLLDRATASVGLPLEGLPECLSPIPLVIPAQVAACHLAIRRGLDPDNPHGLSKVTVTR